ncbi:BrnA antitoxin family protein [Treponema primitia]|uniref:BrnA antitoxin family protein n=1 Tax=Treponema primitia TaxID=88058 RepID=UPI0009DB4854|nr:BrnA antitoxin family protein [Treponema primitia]
MYDEDNPESTPEALEEFAVLARELRSRKSKQDTKPVIALRIEPEALAKYKALGKGYTGTMGDVLNYIVNNPEILAKIL